MNATIGTIIHGTMRPQDIIPAMIDALRELDAPKYQALTMPGAGFSTPPEHALEDDDADWWGSDECAELAYEILPDVLNDYAPEYTYFGSHPGDGSDLGFWIDYDAIENDLESEYLISVGDLCEIPRDYIGSAILTNDHGNVSLYSCTDKADPREIWSSV